MARQNPGLDSKTGHYEAITQILSVTSWNGLTGDITADVVSEAQAARIARDESTIIVGELVPSEGPTAATSVTSWNGLTGAVSFTQYVSAVGGATGAVASFDGGSFT